MTTHLVLLRGINVSGHNIIKMDDLKKMLESNGYTDVTTYIQSGNIFVKTPNENQAQVGFDIKQLIFKNFGHEVPTIVLNKNDLSYCLYNNLYIAQKEVDTKKLYVAFLSKTVDSNAINNLKISQFKPDEAIVDGNKIFIKYAIGAGKTRLDQKYIEKKLNLTATIRSWNTINALYLLFE